MQESVDIVVFLSADWDRFISHGRIEAVARKIQSKNGQVLCVNRPVALLTGPLRQRAKWGKWVWGERHIEMIAPNLYVHTPTVLVHEMLAMRSAKLTAINRAMLARSVRGATRQLDIGRNRLVSWVFHPYQLAFGYPGLVNEELLVLECYDAYDAAYSLSEGGARRIRQLEDRLLQIADLVFVTSTYLYQAKSLKNSNTHLVPNGVDLQHFSKARDPDLPIAPALRNKPHPIIGYVGTSYDHLDMELMLTVAMRHPDWHLAMLGPEQRRSLTSSKLLRKFRALPNVTTTGWVDYAELPQWCRAFDVCIIPYRLDAPFIRAVNPTKVHEYMAMGKPIVSTAIPEMEQYRDVAYVAADTDDFIRSVETALQEDGPEKVAYRLQRAKGSSWDSRAAQIVRALEESLATKEATHGGTHAR